MSKRGYLKVITGPMFSGKSKELISNWMNLQEKFNNKKIVSFHSKVDTRTKMITSRGGEKINSISIKKSIEILDYITPLIKYVLIDEFQFFDKNLKEVIEELNSKNINVLVAGLDLDFKKKPFLIYELLSAQATQIIKMTAVCAKCNKVALYSLRLHDNNYARMSEKIIEVDSNKKKVSYIPVCLKHHFVKLG